LTSGYPIPSLPTISTIHSNRNRQLCGSTFVQFVLICKICLIDIEVSLAELWSTSTSPGLVLNGTLLPFYQRHQLFTRIEINSFAEKKLYIVLTCQICLNRYGSFASGVVVNGFLARSRVKWIASNYSKSFAATYRTRESTSNP